ncbi:MAG TPA: AAA domain-containing protein [Saprospiraceae bacterium]|nr:AAA domain-containing protein [Saprospiraceae bacterium]
MSLEKTPIKSTYVDEARQLVSSIEKVLDDADFTPERKAREGFQSLHVLIDLLLSDENLRFTTLFAKIAYIAARWKLSGRSAFILHSYRRAFERNEITSQNAVVLYESARVLAHVLLSKIWPEAPDVVEPSAELAAALFVTDDTKSGFYRTLDGIIQEIDFQTKTLVFLEDKTGGKEWKVQFDVSDKNEMFTSNIEATFKLLPLPIPVILIDVDLHAPDRLVPAAFVINPDYLVDVTAVANAVPGSNGEYWLYALQKLAPKETGQAVLVGNLANLILDNLVNDEDKSFESLIPTFFHQDALAWCLQKDEEVVQNMDKLRIHFNNIGQVLKNEMETKGISKNNIYLEPSFYCRTYGVQGRLDFFHHDLHEDQADIIELKSSQPFMPNVYGLTDSHYLQTLLYDMIVQATYGGKLKTRNFILYSRLEKEALRYAPASRTRQLELIRTRNEIMLMEHAFAHSAETTARLCAFMKVSQFKNIKGYLHTDLKSFEDSYTALDEAERSYYHHFLSFSAREQVLAKTGEAGPDTTNGLASLWLEDIEAKAERFSILSHLKIVKNESSQEDALLTLQPTDFSNALSNFRKGDVVVLYPHTGQVQDALSHQVFKCNLVSINKEQIVLRLRSPQRNQQLFELHDLWNLEGDVLDSGFRHMYRNLFMFIQAPAEKRRLLLGRQRPTISEVTWVDKLPNHLTPEQKNLISKIVSCKDYFLLWGPPGTGKTSTIIRHSVRTLYETTGERILILAYTNRAVDEINECLAAEGLEPALTRLGSSYAIDPRFSHTLMQNQVANMQKRKDILQFLTQTRIYLSTVSSLMGKLSLLDLLSFDTVIIDEASQILEPNLCGILSRFKRFILIGDHKQLPAVVVQRPSETEIKDVKLRELQFSDARTSLFERMLIRARKEDWFHCWDVLSQQGRMHRDIMQFVNGQFYEGRLKSIPGIERLEASSFLSERDGWLSDRLIFANTPVQLVQGYKTNEAEADLVVEMVGKILKAYQKTGKSFHEHSIGIITPYRAQIALIRSKLPNEKIQIDTVERYQGGAKDIILLSLVTNRPSQLKTLVSLSNEGIDRKLNVALTRAKEQIVVVGNEEILSKDGNYRALIAACSRYQC